MENDNDFKIVTGANHPERVIIYTKNDTIEFRWDGQTIEFKSFDEAVKAGSMFAQFNVAARSIQENCRES